MSNTHGRQLQTKQITLDYAPRRVFMPFHNRTQRWGVIVAHRRAGKTVACINELIKKAVTCPRPDGRFAYIAPFYAQAKDVAWAYLKHYSEPLWGAPPNESELRVDLLNGARIRLYGADNADRMRGLYLDGGVGDEPALMRAGVWGEVLRPALADRQGWFVWIGTPMGHNHFYDLWNEAQADPENWFSLMLRASNTGLLPPGELDMARKQMTAEQYEQEFECSFEAAILGAYFGKEMADADRDDRIRAVKHDAALKVDTWWDLGHNDSTAIWFVQHAFNAIHVIDYYESSGMPLEHYAKVLQQKREASNYVYGSHVWPHDGGHKTLASGGKALSDMMSALGFTVEVQPRQDVQVGITRARQILPRCWFDREKCWSGIEALRQYRKEWDEDRRVFKPTPLHDWSSHGADAFRTGAMAYHDPNASRVVRRDRYSGDSGRKSTGWAA